MKCVCGKMMHWGRVECGFTVFRYHTVNIICLGYKNQSINAEREIIAISSKIHTKHINSICGMYIEFLLTFRHRESSILGQAFRYSLENAFYIFNQQIYFII